MTYWAPLRAGTPKLSAAGPDRNVTIPSLKVSCAKDGAAKVSVVAVTTDTSATACGIREKWFMILSPGLPAVRPPVFGRPGCQLGARHRPQLTLVLPARLWMPGSEDL